MAFLITDGVAIQNSRSEQIWIFHEATFSITLQAGQRVFLSSHPDGNGPIIIDNGIFINGTRIESTFGGTLSDPRASLGRAAEVAYRAVEPIDVTALARADGVWKVQLLDYGYTFTSSRLYLAVR